MDQLLSHFEQSLGVASMDRRTELFRPIVGARAHEEVVDQITFAIRSGGFPPGQKLPSIEELAAQLNVSKPTVGEALRVLAQEGLVETRRGVNGGATVLSDSIPRTLIRISAGNREAGLRELLEARRAVEMEVARLAAVRASEEDFERMQESIDRFASFISDGERGNDPVQQLYLDYLFHYAMGHAARSDLLAYYQHQILQQLVIAIHDYLISEQDPHLVVEFHKKTLKALRTRRPDRVDKAMDEDLRLVEDVAGLSPQSESSTSLEPVP
jgi:GntR family transcriptional regulator, transcriptional repressor for pyruvate dehydrogenase complex